MKNEIAWLLKEKYFGKETKGFFVDVKRLKVGEPVDYVIGFTEFLGCKIDLSFKPLIPRIETAFWVEKVIKDINSQLSFPQKRESSSENKIKALDMFSGSGCIGLAVAKNIKNAEVYFADNDKNAILQIKKNIKLNNIDKNKCRVIQSDIFESFEKPAFIKCFGIPQFDYIFANPPYIPTKNKNKVGVSVLKHEPKQALFGGNDGLFYIKKFLRDAPAFVETSARRGKIYMEFDPPQKNAIEKLLNDFGYKSWQFHKDQFSKYRYVEIQL